MPALNDIVRVAARHRFNDASDLVNVLHFQLLTVPAGGDSSGVLLLADMGTQMSAAFTPLAPNMNNGVDPIDIGIFNVTQDETYGVTSWPGPYVGGSTTVEALPLGVSCLVLFGSTIPHRIGKIYLPPATEGNVTNDQWNGTYITAVTSFTTALRAETVRTNGYSFRYVIWSRKFSQATVPTNVRVAGRPAYQRRRRIGTGS